jgi:prevent-host-death family protein
VEAGTDILTTRAFAEAKAKLSDLMSEVVREHRPVVLDRNRGKEEALVMSVEDLRALLDAFPFNPQVSLSDGEFVVRLAELNLISGGSSFDEAIAELVELIETYAEDYFERFDFYRHTARRQHLPWLLRFALAPASERRDLLVAPAQVAAHEPQPA